MTTLRSSAHDPFTHESMRTRCIGKLGAIGEVQTQLAQFGVKRPLLLTSRRMRAGATFSTLANSYTGSAISAPDVPAHTDMSVIEALCEHVQIGAHDGIVALGGGSVSDAAKAVALLAAEGGTLADHATRYTPPSTVYTPVLRQPKIPIFSIPTTASGAEATASFGVRHEGEKLLFRDPGVAASVIFLDGEANLEMQASVMLDTGMNAVAHCLEGLYATHASPLSDVIALEGLVRLEKSLRQVRAQPQDAHARQALLFGAHLSGVVLASTRSCLHHAVCHVLGAVCGVAHGAVNSVLLPHALRTNLPRANGKLNDAALKLTHQTGADNLLPWLIDLQETLGVATRLRDLNVAWAVLPQVARLAMKERGLAFNPGAPVSETEILAMLHNAW